MMGDVGSKIAKGGVGEVNFLCKDASGRIDCYGGASAFPSIECSRHIFVNMPL